MLLALETVDGTGVEQRSRRLWTRPIETVLSRHVIDKETHWIANGDSTTRWCERDNRRGLRGNPRSPREMVPGWFCLALVHRNVVRVAGAGVDLAWTCDPELFVVHKL